MALINETLREIHFKIVYAGPAQGGKLSNMKAFCKLVTGLQLGYMNSVSISLGSISDYKIDALLLPLPDIADLATARIYLKGADGVVFVADSQSDRLEACVEALESLQRILREPGAEKPDMPVVLQYNKRDLPNAAPIAEVRSRLNLHQIPEIEASTKLGHGVLDSLKLVVKQCLVQLRDGQKK